ncbi:MAG: hypothetical protein JWM68_3520, partial [Verrucomicrobiales bacterium]|nr:hypothetical protein [Verrucomicrobiales bacterium]
TGNLTIGGPNTGTNDVQGFVDEVRISTFASGGFSAADLLYVPPLGNMVITRDAADKVVVSVPAIYSSVTLQEATNLTTTNWQSLASPTVLGDQQVWTNSIQGTTRFYRLTKVAKGKPVPVVTMEQEGSITPLDFNSSFVIEWMDSLGLPNYTQTPVSATAPVICDASASLDPVSGTANTLSFQWEIYQSDFYGGLLYTNPGITGFDAPVLHFAEQPMSDQPEVPSDPDAGYWRVRLAIRHIPFTPGVVPKQETVLWFRFLYLNVQAGGPQ